MSRKLTMFGMGFALLMGCNDVQAPEPDLLPPELQVAVEAAGTTVRHADTLSIWQPSSTLRLSGSASDEVGVARVTFAFAEGAERELSIQPGASVSFAAEIQLATDTSRVAVRAYDAAGNHAEMWIRATVDSVPPDLDRHLQAPARFTSASGGEELIGWHPLPLRVFALRRDPHSSSGGPLAALTYRIDDGQQVSIPAGCLFSSCVDPGFRTDLMLPAGSYTLHLSGRDLAGNTSQRTFSVRVVSLPVASFDQPDTTVASGVDSIRVTGRVFPVDGVNLQYWRRIPNDALASVGGPVAVDPQTGRFSITVPLRTGENQISVGAGLYPVNDWFVYVPLQPGGNGPVSAQVVVTREAS